MFLFPCVALEIGADLPSNHVIDRWLGEPIKAAILPTSIFLTNKKGFPVLSKMHQRLIFRLLKVGGRRVLKVLQLILLPSSHMYDAFFPMGVSLFLSGFWKTISAKLGVLRRKRQMAVGAPEVFHKEPDLVRTLHKISFKKLQRGSMGLFEPGDANMAEEGLISSLKPHAAFIGIWRTAGLGLILCMLELFGHKV